MRWFIFAVSLLLAVTVRANAHGEVVYGCRYYFPPGSNGTSHSHIFRIDPDGTHRNQLTFGNSDDQYPVWTNRGQDIEFNRVVYPSQDNYVMLMDADGSGLHKVGAGAASDKFLDGMIKETPEGPNLSPNGKMLVKPDSIDDSFDDIIDIGSSKILGKVPAYKRALWLSNSEFAGLVFNENWTPSNTPDYSYKYTVYNIQGRQLSSITLTDITPRDELHTDQFKWAVPFGKPDHFEPVISVPGLYIFSILGHKTSYFVLNPLKKTIKFLTASASASYSPDGKRFCGNAFRGNELYSHWKNGNERTVWISYLSVVDKRNASVTYIQRGMIDSQGCNWRPAH